jgi:hypothetical protein
MLLKQLCYSISFLFLLSCNNLNNSNNELNKPKTTDTTFTIKFKNDNNISEDSTKLIKAFDNIYLGTTNQKKIAEEYRMHPYSINGIHFFFYKPLYSEEFGLYGFTLERQERNDFRYMPEEINGIKKLIEMSYPKGQKIHKTYKDQILEVYSESERPIKYPDDFGTELIIYKFIKNEVLIELGYVIAYSPKNNISNDRNPFGSSNIIGFKKEFITRVSFTFLKAMNEIQNIDDSLSKKLQIEKKN